MGPLQPQDNPLIPPGQGNPMIPPGMMPPPPPPSPSLGFQTWASDPQNAMKVQHSMVAPDAPLQPNAGQQNQQPMASVMPPQQRNPMIPPTQPQQDPPPNAVLPDAPMAKLNPMQPPAVQSQLGADTGELQRLQNNGAGLNSIKNPFLRTLARVGDAAGTILAPGVAAAIPGTTVHNWQLQSMQGNRVAQDRAGITFAQKQQQDAAALEDTRSQSAQRAALAAKATAQANSVPDLTIQKRNATLAQLARNGQTGTYDDDGNLTIADDPNSQAYQQRQSLMGLQQARAEAAAAQADLAKNKFNPKGTLYLQAQQRLQTAQKNALTAAQRLGLSAQELGFNQDKFYNPQPTAAERGKGDLAQSAVERVGEMRAIVAKHPEYFGPGEGRATRAQEWVGSQDPDAQTYLSAAQYLSDHSAGVFGGRGKYITEQLHGLTDPHSNPAALNAALDEAERAAKGFVTAGKVHGGPNNMIPPTQGGAPGAVSVTAPDGTTHSFKDQASADKFKKLAGIK